MDKTTGYSGTPLAKKLGLNPGFSIHLINQPDDYWKLFESLPEGIYEVEDRKKESVDFIHFFCSMKEDLEAHSKSCKSLLKKTGMLWVSWPKGSSKMVTDLKRDLIREYFLDLGLVDVKVAAINEDWSGLKFVYRTKDR
ncbi:MAG: DUF3052 domain-containing protein [Bacteroidota bacterium]